MKLDLDELNRDWVAGISGADFSREVEICREQLESLPAASKALGVVISEEDPIRFATEFFGAVSIDLPVILANPSWGASERQQLEMLVMPAIHFDRVGVPALAGTLTKNDRLNRLRSPSCAKATADVPSYAGQEPELQPLQPGAILIPTGGSTGGVKLAIHDWSSLVAASAGVQAFLGGEPIHSCCRLPLYHVSGLMQLVRSFVSGGRIRFDDTDIADCCLSLVPTQLQRMLGDAESIRKLNTARAIFVGGAAMPDALAQKARSHQLPIIPVYGMTETAAMCAAVPARDFLNNPAAGAVPIGDAQFVIEDDGRIRIESPALFKGYQGGEPLDVSQGYLTGDVGSIDAAGRLHVEGRADRIIISGGEKIDPREVEQAICRLPGVEGALAVGLPDAEWGQKLVAFYTGTELVDWKPQLQVSLVNYKIPKRMIRVDELPLDEKGKYDAKVGARLVTPAEAESRTSAGVINVAPTKNVLPTRKTHNLYKGRRSIPGVRYFITLCTKDRRSYLTDSSIAAAILATWRLQHVDEDYTFHCGTVMPDHLHCLFTLGDRLSLGKSIIKFKAKTKEALSEAGLSWQRDFYDHWLRADDSMEGFAKFIYLNPYRKSLLTTEEVWPHWHLSRDYSPEFTQHLNGSGMPPREWLGESLSIDALIKEDLEP